MPMLRRPEITNLPYDEAKGLYYMEQGGKRNYLSPASFGESLPSGQGFFHGRSQFDQNTGKVSKPFQWGNLLSAGIGAALGAPALAGAFGGAGAGATSTATTVPSVAATTGTPAVGASMGKFAKLFGKGGAIDPTELLLGGLSLFGGKRQQYRESFREPGAMTDPRQALYQALQAHYRLGQGLTERAPVKLRSSSVVQPGPAPVNIPGLGFQIGGGLGVDPAIADPSQLEGEDLRQSAFKYDPFQSVIPQKKTGGR